MNYIDLAHKMEGMKTLQTIQEQLNVKRARAIYLMCKLRKHGFLRTKRLSSGKRIYYISPRYAVGGTSYLDIINKYAPLGTRILSSEVQKIHGREISVEETLIHAIKTKEARYVIASLALFRKIEDWSKLYQLAKGNNLLREVGALYDVARTVLKKLQKMPKRFRNLSLPKKNARFKYMIEYLNSTDFRHIEKKWKVYMPLNQADLVEYIYD